MKDRYYFSHDYTCITDPKIQALIGKYGTSGYGLFWRFVEMLHEAPENKIVLKAYVLQAISSTFNEPVERIQEILSYMIEVCELFETENDYIFSQRVLDNISKRKKIREARSKAGKRSAEVRSTNVQQKLTKERKGKEIKIDYNELLNYFNSRFNKSSRIINSSNKNKILARIKEGYTIDDIRLSMYRASLDQFHKDNNFKWCTIEYFTRANTLDKFGYKQNINNKYIPTK